MNRFLSRFLAVLSALLGIALVALLVLRFTAPGLIEETGLADARIGGPFSLIDQDGKRRSDADFRGAFMLVYFGYTYCPDVCPTDLQAMGQALDALGPKADRIVPIFITIDPERDSVPVMKAYAANFNKRLIALTGSPAEIKAAADAYRVYFKRQGSPTDPDYLMDHSAIIYLMSPEGRYLANFGPGTSGKDMARAIETYLDAKS